MHISLRDSARGLHFMSSLSLARLYHWASEDEVTSTHLNQTGMPLKVPVLTSTSLVCHSRYQCLSASAWFLTQGTNTPHLSSWYVTQGTSTHPYHTGMSLRVPIPASTGLACHSGYQHSPLTNWYVTQGTSTNLHQPGMLLRAPLLPICHPGMSLRVPEYNSYQPGISLRVPVLISVSLICHSGCQYSPLLARYCTQGTSTNLFAHHYQPGISAGV